MKNFMTLVLAVFTLPLCAQGFFTPTPALSKTATSALPDYLTQHARTVQKGITNIARLDSDSLIIALPGHGNVLYIASERNSEKWIGRQTDGNGDALIIRDGNKVVSTITLGEQTFQISSLEDSSSLLVELDPSTFPEEADVHTQQTTTLAPDLRASSYVGNMRVLIAYTPAAASKARPNILAMGKLAVEESNQGYRNSGINHQMELAACVPVNYTETNFSNDLSRFMGTNDGYMDEIHALRNQYAADVCVLIVDNGEYCGLGYVNSSSNYAFAEVAYSCMTGNYTFAHEIGHNLGAEHDYQVKPNTGYPYAHGYLSPNQRWRTIMAYSDYCRTCTRVNYWSSPDIRYPGDNLPMGTASRENNARVLNERFPTVKNFRTPPASVTIPAQTISGYRYIEYLSTGTTNTQGNIIVDSNGELNIRSGVSTTFAPGFEVRNGGKLNVSALNMTNGLNMRSTQEIASINNQTESFDRSLTVYPNPLVDNATISYTVSGNEYISITISNAMGTTSTLILNKKWHEPGKYEMTFDASSYPPGIYVVSLIGENDKTDCKVMIRH